MAAARARRLDLPPPMHLRGEGAKPSIQQRFRNTIPGSAKKWSASFSTADFGPLDSVDQPSPRILYAGDASEFKDEPRIALQGATNVLVDQLHRKRILASADRQRAPDKTRRGRRWFESSTSNTESMISRGET